jgi:isoquinoline 1-oxidoreductase beta subunit
MTALFKLDRRHFLQITAVSGSGLFLGLFTGCDKKQAPPPPGFSTMKPVLYLGLDSTGAVTVSICRSEMGQGVRTALAMIVAEALDADWASVKAEGVVASPDFPAMQTAGSASVRTGWADLRKAGATVRAMLVSAAAKSWGVDEAGCSTDKGVVLHQASGRRLGYGELVAVAKDLPVPPNPPYKPGPATLVGTSKAALDAPDEVRGKAVYGIDTRVPGMLFAVVARPPQLGGSVASFVADAALASAGVKHVVEISSGVARRSRSPGTPALTRPPTTRRSRAS